MFSFFFFNDTATTEIYTLSLHDALPIFLDAGHDRGERRRDLCWQRIASRAPQVRDIAQLRVGHIADQVRLRMRVVDAELGDRKSTRLNSSHGYISYAVFCLKKKNTRNTH